MSKKGLSAVVAAVLIILITIAAILLLWAFLLPMLKESIEMTPFDASVSIDFIEGYTCFDEAHGIAAVRIERGPAKEEIVKMQIIFSVAGSSNQTFIVGSSDIPGPNSKKVIRLPVQGKVEEVKVAPIYKKGNREITGKFTSSGEIPNCIIELPEICDSNNICEEGETCGICPNDGCCQSSSCRDNTCDTPSETCSTCPQDCGACPACVPKTCQQIGKECGTWTEDNCNTQITCSPCTGGTCDNGFCKYYSNVECLNEEINHVDAGYPENLLISKWVSDFGGWKWYDYGYTPYGSFPDLCNSGLEGYYWLKNVSYVENNDLLIARMNITSPDLPISGTYNVSIAYSIGTIKCEGGVPSYTETQENFKLICGENTYDFQDDPSFPLNYENCQSLPEYPSVETYRWTSPKECTFNQGKNNFTLFGYGSGSVHFKAFNITR